MFVIREGYLQSSSICSCGTLSSAIESGIINFTQCSVWSASSLAGEIRFWDFAVSWKGLVYRVPSYTFLVLQYTVAVFINFHKTGSVSCNAYIGFPTFVGHAICQLIDSCAIFRWCIVGFIVWFNGVRFNGVRFRYVVGSFTIIWYSLKQSARSFLQILLVGSWVVVKVGSHGY